MLINYVNILYEKQISMAMVLLQGTLTNAVDRGKFAAGIFLYLSNVFDTINHTILLNKLNWFKNYLSNKTKKLYH